MDFHNLTRKELQTLCKENNIPANITNVAMADALKALQHVEGLEEFLNPTQSDPPQTPTKSVIGSSDIPRTACRTSTRRKPIKEEPESSQPLTRTRRGTRKTVSEEADQENKDTNVPETKMPQKTVSEEKEKNVGQDKSDVPKTPVVLSSRRRAPAPSARKKMDAHEETTVQRVYSTRRSVRLLEKNMAELSLKEKKRIEPVMFEELSKEVEEKNASGTDLQTVSEENSVKTDDTEVLLGQNVNGLLENKIELQDIRANKSNDFGVDDCNEKLEVGSRKPDNLDVLLVSDVKDEAHDETFDELDVILGENLEKPTDNKITDANGPADVPVTQLSPETENSNGVLVSQNEKGLNGDQDMEWGDSLAVKFSVDVSTEVDQVVAVQSSLPQETTNSASVGESVEFNSFTLGTSVNLVGKDYDMNVVKDDDHSNSATELKSFTEGCSDYDKAFQESKNDVDAEVDQKDSEAADTDSNATDAFLGDTELENGSGSENSVTGHSEVQVTVPKQSMNVEDLIAETEKYNTEALVDIYVIEAEDVAMTTHECLPFSDNTPTSIKQRSPYHPLVSGGEVVGESENPFSSFASQFPRPQLTPKKSSSKKQTTIQKSTDVLDENKENIDTCGSRLERKKDEVKEKLFEGVSLRKLTKMCKELQIRKNLKNNEDKNVTKKQQQQEVGKTRPALQALEENCMAANEAEKDN